MLILFNKPWGVLCQFTDREGRRTLADFVPIRHVYPAGRLDRDTEGLVVLTDDGLLQKRIADPRDRLPKTYWAQVEGVPGEEALRKLREGVMLRDGRTRPAGVERLDTVDVWDRVPPIRFRKAVPTAWLEVVIAEGRNRQVRRMTAAVGYPTLRLVRVAVGPWTIENLGVGDWREVKVPLGGLRGRPADAPFLTSRPDGH